MVKKLNFYKTLKEENDRFDDIIRKLDAHFGAKKNVTYERFIFKQAKQNSDEETASYITRLRTLSETCNFTNAAEEIRDHFVSSCHSKSLKEKLLRISDLTLDKCLEIGKSKELAKQQAEEMSEQSTSTNRVQNKSYLRGNRNQQN